MRTHKPIRRLVIAALVLIPLLALASTGTAGANPPQYCKQIPFIQGIPEWGFHANNPITGPTGSYTRGHGDISLTGNTISGILCQVDRVRNQPDRLIYMTVLHHLNYHSHTAYMWGYEGNIIKFTVRVKSSTDSRCQAGTIGHVTLFGSYNGVRSDSVQFFFPKSSCSGHDHTYHGTSVNAQVPPPIIYGAHAAHPGH
jgi:hypothetical protein